MISDPEMIPKSTPKWSPMHNINLSFTDNLHLPTYFNDINLGLHFELACDRMFSQAYFEQV